MKSGNITERLCLRSTVAALLILQNIVQNFLMLRNKNEILVSRSLPQTKKKKKTLGPGWVSIEQWDSSLIDELEITYEVMRLDDSEIESETDNDEFDSIEIGKLPGKTTITYRKLDSLN